ncbi:MAG: hypothetical protein ACP5E4_00135 [Candidatus Aenigmatarchaeota archaeon]
MADLTIEDVKKLKGKKRKFDESFDLIVNISGLDLKKPENRIRESLKLPNKVKDSKVCFIAEVLLPVAKKTKHKVLGKNDLDLKTREAKTLARDYDFFAVEAPLMPAAAKTLGKYLSPRNKQMIPVPPALKDLDNFTKGLDHIAQVSITKSPMVQIPLGKTSLKDEQILENYTYAMEKIKAQLDSKKAQIRSVYLKTTMGEPVKVM